MPMKLFSPYKYKFASPFEQFLDKKQIAFKKTY